ncbi:MAG: hypothetical protein O3C19_05880 [Bacteroidetes bacterium]|jgi:hypothetical protein|nr:hypothetical protein [Bacteroidota bacterium]
MATYRFYYSTNEISSLEENYNSSSNIKDVEQVFRNEKGNVVKVKRIDILADPDQINTDEALGYN